MQVRLFRRKVRVNLALQGGGAHGAFTWGVLDRLLEDEELEIGWISATSAGAVNAVARRGRARRRRQERGARQAAQRLGGRAQGRRARSAAPQSVSLWSQRARRRWRRWRACGRPTTSIRSASIRCAGCSPTAIDFEKLRNELADRAADRGDRGGDRALAHLPPPRADGRGGARLRVPADAASCGRDRRRRLLGRRLLGQPRHQDAGAGEPGRGHADRAAQSARPPGLPTGVREISAARQPAHLQRAADARRSS